MRLATELVAIFWLAASVAAAGVLAQPPTEPAQSELAGTSPAVTERGAPQTHAQATSASAPASPAETSIGAQAGPAAPAGQGSSPAAQAGLQPDTDVTIDRHTGLSASVGYGGPLGAAASLTLLRGLGADVREGSDRVKAVCAAPIRHCANGFLLETAAGLHGGRLSLGFGGRAKVDEEDFHVTVGLGLKLSAVRTWNADEDGEPDATYLGPEIDFVVKRIGAGVGVLWRLSDGGSATPRFSWSIGLVL